MSSGAKVISAFIRETVAGTTPASGDWSLLKRTSWGVKPTQNKGENNEIGGSRMAQGATPGTVDVGGDVGTKFRWGQHDDFLASCFGAEWSGDSLTMGNERITFSLATYASDVGIASVVRGAQVGSWKMQIPNDGDITATVTFAGLDWESKADDTNFIKGEPVDSAGKLRYSFKEVSAVSLNGVAGGISGSVNANSGTLNNVTINENCQIKGKLSANQIEGDIVKTVGKAFPRDSRAPERWPSGTITVRIYDDQPFDRQIVIPAVAFCGAKHERENNDIYSSCRLIVKKNGAEIYNRTALDNTLIYSGVIDMPAGHGHMTLEFSVSAWLVNDWYPTASISDLLVVVMKKATAGISIS